MLDDPASGIVSGMVVLAEPAPPEMPLPAMGLSIFFHVMDSVFDVDRSDEVVEPLADVVDTCSELSCCTEEPLLCAIAALLRRSYVRPSLASEGLQSQVLTKHAPPRQRTDTADNLCKR